MSVAASRVSVTTTATPLHAVSNESLTVVITNRDATASVDIADGGVTAGAGYELKAGQVFANGPVIVPPGQRLYAIAASGTVRVDVLAIAP